MRVATCRLLFMYVSIKNKTVENRVYGNAWQFYDDSGLIKRCYQVSATQKLVEIGEQNPFKNEYKFWLAEEQVCFHWYSHKTSRGRVSTSTRSRISNQLRTILQQQLTTSISMAHKWSIKSNHISGVSKKWTTFGQFLLMDEVNSWRSPLVYLGYH